ncbi:MULTISPECIES: VOC family protein [Deefgea]|uniref:Diguanylate cyclase n=1 Tax=Deefgea chitinilytica TaxID=570276 RepID=A0ABS2CEH0_9NEIS|nr:MULTISPECIES: VOC family protein [Deefgea]MBM5572407.1 diguanylate cyclase [Deefgea chitinilytica]MBM9889643.1 diguanylate cyclase [Deefgea sp. CFH1-16]
MKNLGLNHINLRVPADLLEAMRAFYCELIQLQVGFRPPFGTQGYWLYAGAQPVIHLSVLKGDASVVLDAPRVVDHIAFTCCNIEQAVLKLDQLGINYRRLDFADEGISQIFIQDPAKNTVELHFHLE